MSKLENALSELQEVVKETSYDTTVCFNVHITAEGTEVTIDSKSPETLRRDGIAMRNIKGEFIK